MGNVMWAAIAFVVGMGIGGLGVWLFLTRQPKRPLPHTIGSDDLYVHLRSLDADSRVAIGNAAFANPPLDVAAYLRKVREDYDRHEAAEHK